MPGRVMVTPSDTANYIHVLGRIQRGQWGCCQSKLYQGFSWRCDTHILSGMCMWNVKCFLSAKLEIMHLPWPFDSICSLPISFLHRAHTLSVLPSMACTAPESCSTCTFGVHSKSISSIWAYWVFIKNSITSRHPRLLSEIIVQPKSKLCHQLKSWVGYYWCILCYKIKCKNVLQ